MKSLLNGIAVLLLDLSERVVDKNFPLAERLQRIAGELIETAAEGSR